MAEAVSAVAIADSAREAKQVRTVVWVMSLALVGLLFDGYDLVVYGACVSTFLRDPTQLGVVTPAIAGQLGSYALFGVLVGALLAGSVGDILGRRKVMLFAYAWFSIGMAATALTSSVAAFGATRFLTGLGVGALVATTAAVVSEFAPMGNKNLCKRDRLFRRSGWQPDGRGPGDRSHERDRLALSLHDRRTATRHAFPACLFQDAGIGGVARCTGPHRRSAGIG